MQSSYVRPPTHNGFPFKPSLKQDPLPRLQTACVILLYQNGLQITRDTNLQQKFMIILLFSKEGLTWRAFVTTLENVLKGIEYVDRRKFFFWFIYT